MIFADVLYSNHLRLINGIKFTRREIDIIAFIISGRSAKRIAHSLFLTPKTVENYTQNIMVKLACNSRENIIDFIEKSNKFSVIKEYYTSLLTQVNFEQQLTKIASKVSKVPLACRIFYQKDEEVHRFFIHYLQKHLTLAGINKILEVNKSSKLTDDLVQNTTLSADHPTICLVTNKQFKDLPKANNSKELVPHINNKDHSQHMSIMFLVADREGLEYPQCVDIDKSVLELKNYYTTVLRLIMWLSPELNLEHLITEFQNHAGINHDTSISIEEPISSGGPVFEARSHLQDLYKIARNRISWIILASLLTAIILTFLIFNKDVSKQTQVRSELLTPSENTFLNRPEFLSQINESLNAQQGIATLALVGIGGSGKTTLARSYAKQQKIHITWEINAETKQSLITSFDQLSCKLAQTEDDKILLRKIQEMKNFSEKEENLFSFIKQKLKVHGEWLLIFDNVENIADILKYFPCDQAVWGRGKIIVTTRDSNIKNNTHINRTIFIKEMAPSEKLKMFVKIMNIGSKTQFPDAEKSRALEFLNQIPSFPLDVSIAAHYLKSTEISYKHYLERLVNFSNEFESMQTHLLRDSGDYNKTRYSIVMLSLRRLIENNIDFKDLMLLISLLDSQDIPRKLLESYKSAVIVDKFIYQLKKYSLITGDHFPDGGVIPTISFHRDSHAIIRKFLLSTLNSNREAHIYPVAIALNKHLIEILHREDFSEMKLMIIQSKAFLSHEDLLTNEMKSLISCELGGIYFHFAMYKDAASLLEENLRNHVAFKSDNYHIQVRTLRFLGNTYRYLGYYHKAKSSLAQALQICQTHFPQNHTELIAILGNLGCISFDLGNYKEAKDIFESCLTKYDTYISKDNISYLWILLYLSRTYMENGQYKQATDLLEKCLVLYRKQYPKNHIKLAWPLATQGYFYYVFGNYDKSKETLEESLKISQKFFHSNHISLGRPLAHLGVVYSKMGNYKKGKELLERSLAIRRENLPDNDYWIFNNLESLAYIYMKTGDYKQAKSLLEDCYKTYKSIYGLNHIKIAHVLMRLGEVYLLENDLDNAEKYLLESMKIYKLNNGIGLYELLEVLAEFYQKKSTLEAANRNDLISQNYKRKSSEYLKQALKIVEVNFPSNSQHLTRIKCRLKIIE